MADDSWEVLGRGSTDLGDERGLDVLVGASNQKVIGLRVMTVGADRKEDGECIGVWGMGNGWEGVMDGEIGDR